MANTFDVLNRLTRVLDPVSSITDYAYNASGALEQVTDPRALAATR